MSSVQQHIANLMLASGSTDHVAPRKSFGHSTLFEETADFDLGSLPSYDEIVFMNASTDKEPLFLLGAPVDTTVPIYDKSSQQTAQVPLRKVVLALAMKPPTRYSTFATTAKNSALMEIVQYTKLLKQDDIKTYNESTAVTNMLNLHKHRDLNRLPDQHQDPVRSSFTDEVSLCSPGLMDGEFFDQRERSMGSREYAFCEGDYPGIQIKSKEKSYYFEKLFNKLDVADSCNATSLYVEYKLNIKQSDATALDNKFSITPYVIYAMAVGDDSVTISKHEFKDYTQRITTAEQSYESHAFSLDIPVDFLHNTALPGSVVGMGIHVVDITENGAGEVAQVHFRGSVMGPARDPLVTFMRVKHFNPRLAYRVRCKTQYSITQKYGQAYELMPKAPGTSIPFGVGFKMLEHLNSRKFMLAGPSEMLAKRIGDMVRVSSSPYYMGVNEAYQQQMRGQAKFIPSTDPFNTTRQKHPLSKHKTMTKEELKQGINAMLRRYSNAPTNYHSMAGGGMLRTRGGAKISLGPRRRKEVPEEDEAGAPAQPAPGAAKKEKEVKENPIPTHIDVEDTRVANANLGRFAIAGEGGKRLGALARARKYYLARSFFYVLDPVKETDTYKVKQSKASIRALTLSSLPLKYADGTSAEYQKAPSGKEKIFQITRSPPEGEEGQTFVAKFRFDTRLVHNDMFTENILSDIVSFPRNDVYGIEALHSLGVINVGVSLPGRAIAEGSCWHLAFLAALRGYDNKDLTFNACIYQDEEGFFGLEDGMGPLKYISLVSTVMEEELEQFLPGVDTRSICGPIDSSDEEESAIIHHTSDSFEDFMGDGCQGERRILRCDSIEQAFLAAPFYNMVAPDGNYPVRDSEIQAAAAQKATLPEKPKFGVYQLLEDLGKADGSPALTQKITALAGAQIDDAKMSTDLAQSASNLAEAFDIVKEEAVKIFKEFDDGKYFGFYGSNGKEEFAASGDKSEAALVNKIRTWVPTVEQMRASKLLSKVVDNKKVARTSAEIQKDMEEMFKKMVEAMNGHILRINNNLENLAKKSANRTGDGGAPASAKRTAPIKNRTGYSFNIGGRE